MAESAVTFLLEKLAPLFENELQSLRGGGEEIVYVRGELERIRAFLRVADTLEERDEEVKVWVKQIRDVAHETEDILDEFTILLAHDHASGLYGLIHKFSCCIKNMKARYRIASQIKAINSRIRNISDGHRRLSQKFCVAEQGSSSTSTGWQDRREDALLLDMTDLVGIEERKSKLVDWLVDGRSGREVVSLAGMGGLGKTTLAKQVYDDAEVKKHFSVHAWITVSRSYKMEELLKDIVQQLFAAERKPAPKNLESQNSSQLKSKIKEVLQKRRYLIVLDDVWHVNEWDAVKYALPTNNCGSRVMLTTRNADLAFTSRIESEGKVYNLEPLLPEESWTLFCRKTFRGNSCPRHLEDICKNILRKCEGLPLAIVAISGVLAAKDKRRIDEWEMVRRSLGAEIEDNNKLLNLKKVLSLSFNDLPYYLKSCFLYVSIFPEDHLIEHMKLIRLWVAEGFVEAKNGKELEDVAEDYFNELLNRSLLQVAETASDGRVKTCRPHDLLREIIISKSRDQNFAVIAKDQNATWPDKIRRLSIHYTVRNVQLNRCVSQLRSLFMFGVVEKSPLRTLFPNGFRLLHVLDLQGAPIKMFPVQVMNLYYLRYLSLKETKVSRVPSYIGKLQHLETLNLKHTYVTELPDEILKLQRLRHLLVYRYKFESYAHFHSKNGFKSLDKIGQLQSLQKLCFVEANHGNGNIMIELGKLTKLRRLGVVKLRREDGKSLCSSIENLRNIRALSLLSVEEDEILDLEHLFSPPPLLQRLYLTGRLETLPHWIPNLESLVRVHLKWSRLKCDPLESLQVLPNLVHLELLQVYEGDTLCFKVGGFKKLKLLGIDKFDELRCVEVEVGALPRVEKLSIQRCKLLEKAPLGIEHLTKLKVLEFFDMPPELIQTLLSDEQGGDYGRVKHIPEVYSTYWRDASDPYLRVTLTFSPKKGTSQASTLYLRIPIWTNSEGATATINSQSLRLPAPGSFLSVNRKWRSSDKLTLQIPISLRTEAIKDDRHEYASVQAILYGPYLLAGHTSGDWNLKTGSGNSLSDSITPIPGSYNGQLVSFSQESGISTFVLTNSNQSISMEKLPESGTDASLQATFRLVLKDSSSSKLSSVKDVIGKSVMLEPFHLPGMLLVQQGKDRSFALTNSADDDGSSTFRVVSGLDGKDGTVSLESGIQNGCYVYSGVDYKSGQSMKLSCKSETSSDTGFNQGASFVMNKGLTQYHPISFVAKGDKRNFLLAPLHSLRDESYTIYFNIQP